MKPKVKPPLAKIRNIGLLCVLCAVATAAVATVSCWEAAQQQKDEISAGAQRGMFEWNEDGLKKPKEAAALAGELGLDRWYQELPEKINTSRTKAFVRALRKKSVGVYALVGSGEWGFEADGASLIEALDTIADYNDKVTAPGRLAGVMVDVEPYTSQTWKEDPQKWAPVYLSGMKAAYAYAKERGLPIIACIPRHYDDQGLSDMLRSLIAETCDEVAVMDYDCGNEAAAIATEAAFAAEAGKPLHCILEFQRVGKHGLVEEKTYYNKGFAAAEEAWRAVAAAFPEQEIVWDYHWTEPVREILEREEAARKEDREEEA